MELLQELAVTALLSLLCAFLFAKLVSIASSFSSSSGRDASKREDYAEDVVSGVDLSENEHPAEGNGDGSLKEHVKIGELEKQGLENVNVKMGELGGESKRISGLDLELVKGQTELVKVGVSDQILVKDVAETVKFQGSSLIPVKEALEMVNEVPVVDETCELEKSLDDVGKPDVELEQVDTFGIKESDEEVKKCRAECELEEKQDGERCAQVENVMTSTEGGEDDKGKDDEEDDWEGIERSEIEKLFAVAAEFVNSGGSEFLSKVDSDLQMKLYGLHKVATEGPCYELQPSALKISARVKWHAWRQLGSMNPETAMEQYINLLSTLVPGWMAEKSSLQGDGKGDGGSGSPESGIHGTEAPSSISFLSHQMVLQKDRKLEDTDACTREGDAIGVQELLEQGNSVDSLGCSVQP